jgi:hypothetical protein
VLIIANNSTDEDPGLRIESFAVINLRGVSTNKTIYFITMQTYKELNISPVVITCCSSVASLLASPTLLQDDDNLFQTSEQLEKCSANHCVDKL